MGYTRPPPFWHSGVISCQAIRGNFIMRVSIRLSLTVALALGTFSALAATDPQGPLSTESATYARDPNQAVDQGYTDQILKFTTVEGCGIDGGCCPQGSSAQSSHKQRDARETG